MLILPMLIALSGSCGCWPEEQDTLKAAKEANDNVMTLHKKLDEMYGAYLAGNREEVKHNIEQAISLIENSKVPVLVQAHGLWLEYSRLYVLERISGNELLAEASLLKARYWLLRKAELAGTNSEEAARQVIQWFTADKCVEIVDQWDKAYTQGKGPNYARDLTTSGPKAKREQE
jgi:hypothetical protein